MKYTTKSVTETLNLGKLISKNLKPGDIICLFGQLGSGKTVLTKGIAQGLKIKRSKVISPSFVLIRHYRGRLNLHHFDLYRLEDLGDIFGLGYEEYLYDRGVSVIEWADRLKSLLPQEYLKVSLSVKNNSTRLLEFGAKGSRYNELIKKIHEDFSH